MQTDNDTFDFGDGWEQSGEITLPGSGQPHTAGRQRGKGRVGLASVAAAAADADADAAEQGGATFDAAAAGGAGAAPRLFALAPGADAAAADAALIDANDANQAFLNAFKDRYVAAKGCRDNLDKGLRSTELTFDGIVERFQPDERDGNKTKKRRWQVLEKMAAEYGVTLPADCSRDQMHTAQADKTLRQAFQAIGQAIVKSSAAKFDADAEAPASRPGMNG